MITGNIKSLLQIKFKNRHDNYADQYSRIFMVKMAMISSMLLGLNWFKDTIRCTVPNFAQLDKGYIHQACWIQGMNNVFYGRIVQIVNLKFLRSGFMKKDLISSNIFSKRFLLMYFYLESPAF